ncbi:DUF6153 family protein [Kribbella sp. NPDC005582]|uniref:DUF6153 family protein n=1 Tax=Kribbella sp. NPDC005582 TaxID=3156893 RepID=UPI0033B49FB5
MTSQHISTRRGSTRALVAVLLLAGVLAMHGLTGNHDATMAMTSHLPSTAMGHEAAPKAAVESHSTHVTQTPAATPIVDQTTSPEPVVVESNGDGHLHSMGDACLGMLVALLLALIAALAQRSLTVSHPVVLARATVIVADDGPSPPWHRPTLSKLCILRT